MKYLIIAFFLVSSFAFAEQQYKTHKVSRGETVESIARDYGVPVSAIYKLNPDAKKGISSATTLIIPPKEVVQEKPGVSFKNHRVKSKETLYSLSKEYNVSIDDIKRYNKFLYSEPLKKGAELRIPSRPVLSETSPAITQSQSPSEIENSREHVVLAKETKYGISREYGITVEELEEMNPWMDTLQPGMMLKIVVKESDEPSSPDDGEYRTYEVQPQQTMYSLTRQFEISEEDLIKLNPELRDGLKAGMVIKLPNKEVGSKELVSATEDLEKEIRHRDTKNMVLMLPFNLNKVGADSLSNAKESIRKDQVLQISLDFYSGVLLALDSAKSKGLSVNLQVLDSRQDPYHIDNLVRSNNFDNVDVVIGPLLQETSERTAQLLSSKNIPVISPISTKEVRNMQNYVQSRPTKEMMENVIIQYLNENTEDKNIILIADGSASGVKNRILSKVQNIKEVNPSSGNVNRNSLTNAMDKNKENWIILESNSIGLLSSVTSRLNAMSGSYNISLFTTDRNKAYDSESVSNRHLGKLNFHFPSVDKSYDKIRNADFIAAYRKIYDLDPNQYAVRGFDITYDMILRLAAFGSISESFDKFEGTTEYAENKFHYQAMNNGGFYNNAVYILKYDKDLNRHVVR